MKNKQSGSTLVVALVILTIITLVAAYSIEGTAIQSKMVASSLFSTLTYQECRNEQEANIRFFNDGGGAQRVLLLDMIDQLDLSGNPKTIKSTDSGFNVFTKSYDNSTVRSSIFYEWSYIREDPAARGGYNIDVESQFRVYVFENRCSAGFRFSNNIQVLGAAAEGLQQVGNLN